MIQASVTLPLFRTQYIAWLQLESLCRQEDINFDWELIIAKELNDETFGIKQIGEYQKRLENVGCVRLKYIPLKKWICLGAKKKLLIEKTTPSSKLIFFSAADIYSAPQRLRRLYDLQKEYPDGDCFVPMTAINYDIKTGIAVMRDPEKMKLPDARIDDVTGLAIAGNLLRDAAKVFDVGKMIDVVDIRIWKACKQIRSGGLKVIRDFSEMWKYGLNVNGLNNISDRTQIFKIPNKNPLIVPYPYHLSETIPQDILDRLKECKKFLSLHIRKVPP